jgi:hypothetical protein
MLGWLCNALDTVETDTFNRCAISLRVAGFCSIIVIKREGIKKARLTTILKIKIVGQEDELIPDVVIT